MFIGDLLIAHGLVNAADVAAALDKQKTNGGRLGAILVALGRILPIDLEAVLQAAPSAPTTIEETGLQLPDLLSLAVKAMHTFGVETPSAIADVLKLSNGIVQLLLDHAQERKLLDILGSTGIRVTSELRYSLSDKGKVWALDALGQNQYVGPAPVSLSSYQERLNRQAIGTERVDRASIEGAFIGLAMPDKFADQIGPAINSGRSILLYGAPGNGKTTVAERIGSVFGDVVYIPYCFEVEGQIIKVFDPGIHHAFAQEQIPTAKTQALRREDSDPRWVPCPRPFVVAGGELTLEMLDLSFNPLAKFYEAPLHVKALGGVFVIDDFGRQLVSPTALLNRWIVPLERRIDYLKLHTGKSFSLPFDALVVFSTNLAPQDLMDPAFLRRIPYKLEIGAPTASQYRDIFRSLAKGTNVEVPDPSIDFVIAALRDRGMPLASYQPKFIVDQVVDACKFAGIVPQFRPELLMLAFANLAIHVEPAADDIPSVRPLAA